MGDTRRFAERMALVDMEPRGDLTSTGYALADPGKEYLVLDPGQTAGPFTVTLEAGTYTAEWYSVDRRKTVAAGQVVVEGTAATSFTAPFGGTGPAVLYLKKVGG
jgi:hypothetical protein